MKMQKKKKNK